MNYRGCHREKAAANVAIPVFFSSTDIGIATVASLLRNDKLAYSE
jgi:hypothetical protein